MNINRKNIKYINEIDPQKDNQKTISLVGWIHEIRNLGGICFLIIRDREGFAQVTILKKKTEPKLLNVIDEITRESVVYIEGIVKYEEKVSNGYEILPINIEILNLSNSPLPMDVTGKVNAEFDTRFDSRYLDLRKEKNITIFKLRSIILSIIRNFFNKYNFIEVTTPKIVASATEGGTELFPITYFDKIAFLNQSPQLYKQILMGSGFDRIYEIGPIFRAEEHNTRKHLNEATSIDIESSFIDYLEAMNILEQLIYNIHIELINNYKNLLDKLNITLKIPKLPFKRYTYSEVIDILTNKIETFDEKISFGSDLSTKAEYEFGKYVFNTTNEEYYFIIDWPSSIKPFYAMVKEDNKLISKSFDLMHIKMELSSGAQRCHIYDILCNQIKEKGLNIENFEFYLTPFKYGMPPHSGFGVGLERLIMVLFDLNNIREAVLFPRDRNRLLP